MQTETYIENGVTINIVTPDESDLASTVLKEQRKAICIECKLYDSEGNSCSSCGCIVDTLMTYNTSICPDNRW